MDTDIQLVPLERPVYWIRKTDHEKVHFVQQQLGHAANIVTYNFRGNEVQLTEEDFRLCFVPADENLYIVAINHWHGEDYARLIVETDLLLEDAKHVMRQQAIEYRAIGWLNHSFTVMNDDLPAIDGRRLRKHSYPECGAPCCTDLYDTQEITVEPQG